MGNSSWIQKLVSSAVFGIVLLATSTAFADQDRENLVRLQVRQDEITLQLKSLQGRVRSIKPTDWELKALQSLIEESNCLSGGAHPEINLNRYEFAIALDKCFKGLEKVALAKDPNRLIRRNIATLRRLQAESLPDLVKSNSVYGVDSVASVKWKTRILGSPFWDSNISDEDMRSLRYLIYKYSSTPEYSYSGKPCGGNLPIEPYRPIGRIEYSTALSSILGKIYDLFDIDLVKIDKIDFPILQILQGNYAAELASYKGLLCALPVSPPLSAYLDNEAWLDSILKIESGGD